MYKFIFFTKTMYSEPPRIRHQLAKLLISFGNEVVFYQKPAFFHINNKSLLNQKELTNIELKQTKQLIHHQLRLIQPISWLNSLYELFEICKSIDAVDSTDIIVNFNYDYYFLRKIFKRNKIITIINDDFVAQSKFNQGKHVLKQLSKTVQMSDVTLTVSSSLYNQVKQFTENVDIFLPWSVQNYTTPVLDSPRKSILIWAHINERIDFNLISFLLKNNPDFNFHLVGPVAGNTSSLVKGLQSNFSNLLVFPPTDLEQLPLNEYFVSILPYRDDILSVKAVTAANKTFQLLSKGLPLITYGMPNYLEHDAIFKANTYIECSDFIDIAHNKFNELQPDIKELVNSNLGYQRYQQIISIIS